MNIRTSHRILITLFLAAAAVPWAQAATIIGNMPSNDVAITNFSPGTNQKAIVFTMGSQDFTVDSVTLRLQNYSTVSGDVARVGFFLDSGNGTTTGAQVGSFLTAPSSSSNSTDDFSFLPNGSLTLEANTRYWLLADVDAGTYGWKSSNPTVTPIGSAADFDFYRFSTDDGATYANAPSFNSFQIDGTVVNAAPEPSRALLLCGGLMGVMLRRRRRLAKA